MDIFAVIRGAKSNGASDVHLVIDSPPILRVDGLLQPVPDLPPLTAADIDQALEQLATEKQMAAFEENLELDFAYSLPDVTRLRCNAGKQQGTTTMAIRLVPNGIPSLAELGLPQACQDLALRPRGMIVISGPTGSGKSTTLAAMINHLNTNENRRIVTVEDPVEYIHTNQKCTITQREIGVDTLSFAEALRHVLRQDPDVILVGEMRDAETATAALSIAETGHLVMTTGHAPSAYQAIERIIDLFPADERHLAQSRLASLLVGVLCQTLIPRSDGSGRVAAIEIMLANPAVRTNIRDGKIHQLPNLIRTSGQQGMQLLDDALISLFRRKLISRDSVIAYCNDRDQVEKQITTSSIPSPNSTPIF